MDINGVLPESYFLPVLRWRQCNQKVPAYTCLLEDAALTDKSTFKLVR